MSVPSPTSVLEQLNWRYAVKKFDPNRKIPAELWSQLEEATVLSPSSYGLQPWKFYVVNDPAVRAKLLPVSWGQNQIVDASHLIVFALKIGVGPADAERLVQRSAAVRGIPVETLNTYRDMMTGSLSRTPANEVEIWMGRQVFIALGFFLSAAAMMGVDACPMEGFQPEKYDEILGLTAKGYKSVVVATAGYRDAGDKYAALKKVRYPIEDMIERV